MRHILASTMQTRGTWREFPALRAGWVKPAHGGGVADRDGVHRPLGAEREGALSCSVGKELNSRAGVPTVLHPAVL